MFSTSKLKRSQTLVWYYSTINSRGKTPGNTYIFIRKYQEISKNFRKYIETSENTCKFQERLGNIRKYYEIPGNTRPKI
jgi:hypothetical protein